ncbi:FHA domain-containing protein [Baekduia sp.]|uniref:FHA domain-containing protein n=1 Tax=Baekduia sp. TaxID=2600305 RepID=UPI002E04EED5|nr:FHA domain-containing protein [Baekduia sp.]
MSDDLDLDISLRRRHEPADGVVLRSDRPQGEAALLYAGQRVPLREAAFTIGREPACDLVLTSGLVSPLHARVERRDGVFQVADLDSRMGTYINGERFAGAARRLRSGDSIAIGDEILHFTTIEPTGLPPVEILPDTATLRMDRPRVVIGRALGNDIVLDHPTVSPVHAEIIAGETGVRLKDISRGGTGVRVNGQLVSRMFLKIGDEIAIGPYRLVFDGALLQQRAAGLGMRLDAEDIRFDVTGATILQPTSLSVLPGELVAVIGESGAGKSTLMKSLCGVQQPTGGRVMLNGEPVVARRADIGYVPQDEIVHRLLTIREALGYAAELRLPQDATAADRAAAVARVIEEVGLAEHADTRIGSLSGGQRKRAGVAVELIDEPGVLFLDEPTTGLDPGLEQRMMRLFRSLADAGRPVLLVTHATGSLRLCDQVAVMGRGGLLCFYGPPSEALEFFGVERFDDLYVALEEGGAALWHERFAAERIAGTPAAAPPAQAGAPPPPREIGPQAAVLVRRYSKLFLRDRKNLRILAAQVPLLALATALLFKRDVFLRSGGESHAGESAQLLFLLVTVAAWFGAIASAREIIKERTVVQRELTVGVRPSSYLISKAVLLFALTGVQTVTMAMIVLLLRPLHEPASAAITVMFLLVLTAWAGVGMGLLVSVVVRSEDQASSFIPLILVPQLLFGGAIVPVHEMGAIMGLLSKVIVAQWAFAAVGHTIHLQQRIDEDEVFRQASRYGHHFFGLPTVAGTFVLVLFLAAFAVALHRRLPAFAAEGEG